MAQKLAIENPDDLLEVVFVIMQNGSVACKQVDITRATFIEYNARPHRTWAELYEMIVRDKAYLRILDLSNSN